MKSLLQLWPYLRPYRWQMLVVVLSTIGVTLTNLVNPWLVRSVVQIVSDQSGGERLVGLTAGLMLVFVGRALFRYLTSYVAHVMAWNLVGDLRVALYGHLQRLSPRFYADRQTGELLTRVIKDTQDIEPLIAHYIPDLIVNVLLLVGVAVVLFSMNPALTLLTLVPMPLLVINGVVFNHRMNSWFKVASHRLGALSAMVQDNLTGMREIQ